MHDPFDKLPQVRKELLLREIASHRRHADNFLTIFNSGISFCKMEFICSNGKALRFGLSDMSAIEDDVIKNMLQLLCEFHTNEKFRLQRELDQHRIAFPELFDIGE